MKNFNETEVSIPVEHGQLQAMISTAEQATTTAIICHPHSQMGGTMNNKVVTTVVRAWQQMNFNTVRFNFRGVGASTGEFDHGNGEQQDLAAVITWAKNYFGTANIVLAGFSFGSYVALKFCQHYTPDTLILIAPPAEYVGFNDLHLPASKNYLVVAEQDEVVSTPASLAWAKDKNFQKIYNMSEASHFFHGKLLLLRDFILDCA